MGAESLKSLGWLLLWGGLFFVMMRYGCGRHIMGGRGGHGNAAPGGGIKDPVCGMTVDLKYAAAAAVRGGSTYYFCSTSCRDKFEHAVDKYVRVSAQGGHQHGGHNHG